MGKPKNVTVSINEKDLKRLQYRLNTDTYSMTIRIAVALCANMNRADFNQFLAIYHKQVATNVKKNVDKYSKKKHYHNEKIEAAGGLDIIILWKILDRTQNDLAEYIGVGTDKLIRYLKTRNLTWSTIIENENEIIYKGKFGTLKSNGGDVKTPKKKKKKPKKKWRKKTSKKDRHRKYYHVTKHRNKNYKRGFVYRYSYTKNGKKQHIDNKDIKELERLVKAKGLKWEKVPMPFDYEIRKKKKEMEEKEK